jgi:hypothetical protein
MWAVEWRQRGKTRWKVFDCDADKDNFVSWLWKRGVDPVTWDLMAPAEKGR